jgi:hypothetical protein
MSSITTNTSNDGLYASGVNRMVRHEPNTVIFYSGAALCWVSERGWEVLINGQKRGVSPKHRFNSKFRCGSHFNTACLLCVEMPPSPMLSKVSLMGLSHTTLSVLGRTVFLWVYLFT